MDAILKKHCKKQYIVISEFSNNESTVRDFVKG